MANGKWTNNDMQKKIILYGELKIEQHDPDNNKKTGGEFMCSGMSMVSSSCSTCDPDV
jgi:hypothetical protein